METFSWMMHRFSTEYPETGFRVQLGNSYQYAAPPVAPDQRKITLKFATMKYFVNTAGVVDATIQPEINFLALENFYNAHKLWRKFYYNHPVYGQLVCKFNKPLQVPDGIPDGGGCLEPFEVELIEVP